MNDILTAAVFAFINMGPMEMAIIGIIAVMLFGRRLPEVGRSLGRSIVEFKKGIRGIEDEIDAAAKPQPRVKSYSRPEDSQEPTAPKFEPPREEPPVESSQAT